MFYELLAGLNDWDKQELYLQGAETYYYLNQVHHTPMNTDYSHLCFFFFLIIFSLALFLLYMSHLVFLSRVVSVN